VLAYCALILAFLNFISLASQESLPKHSHPATSIRPLSEEHLHWSLGLGQGMLFTNENGAHGGVNYPMNYTSLSLGFFPTKWLEIGIEGGLGITSLAKDTYPHHPNAQPFSSGGWAWMPVLAIESNVYFLDHFYTGAIVELKFASRQTQMAFGGLKFGKEFLITPRFAWGPEAQFNLSLGSLNPIFALLVMARTFF
jgi:hypothetical protein